MPRIKIFLNLFAICFIMPCLFSSCTSRKVETKEEQIVINESDPSYNTADSVLNALRGNISFNQIPSKPTAVILTGLADHRLVTVYKSKLKVTAKERGSLYSYSDNDGIDNEMIQHFMPGLDILYGYNLLNIAHYDIKNEKLNFLFNRATLVKPYIIHHLNQTLCMVNQ